MRNAFRVLTSRPLLGHWRSKLAVAAAVLVAATIGVFALQHGSQQTAYALDDLPQRLLEIKSIYLTGWLVQPSWTMERGQGARVKYPMKFFAERPDCFWHMWYGFSGPDATHNDVRVRSGYIAGRGTKRLDVFTNDKTVLETTVAPVQNELSTEMWIQVELPQQLLGGRPRDFVKTGKEPVGDVLCDVYDFQEGKIKKRLWLDPRTGLPARIASYRVEAGHEIPSELFDHVEVNVPADATGLSFAPPEGYQVTRAPAPAAENPFYWPVASGQSDDVSLSVWHCLNIDDKALLTALSCESPAVAKGGIAKAHLEFTLDETRSCQYKEIASAEADGHRWTWLLVWPKQAGQPVGNDELLVSYRSKRGGGLHLGSDVIRLREDRFNAMLKEIQRLSKTHVPGSAEPFSLDTLRAQLNGR